jgi:molybdenum cofactor cytidylyltransferase
VTPAFSPTVIVLASGRGERFKASGGSTHKLQALLAGKTVLQHTLDAVLASGLPWHLEQADHPGMGDSIAAAVAATPQAVGWLVLPADLPLIQSSTLLAIAAALATHDVVLPLYVGQRGHPVGFGAACRGALLQLVGSQGAAAIVRAYGAVEVAVNDIGVVTDIDTVQDLLQAESILASAKS